MLAVGHIQDKFRGMVIVVMRRWPQWLDLNMLDNHHIEKMPAKLLAYLFAEFCGILAIMAEVAGFASTLGLAETTYRFANWDWKIFPGVLCLHQIVQDSANTDNFHGAKFVYCAFDYFRACYLFEQRPYRRFRVETSIALGYYKCPEYEHREPFVFELDAFERVGTICHPAKTYWFARQIITHQVVANTLLIKVSDPVNIGPLGILHRPLVLNISCFVKSMTQCSAITGFFWRTCSGETLKMILKIIEGKRETKPKLLPPTAAPTAVPVQDADQQLQQFYKEFKFEAPVGSPEYEEHKKLTLPINNSTAGRLLHPENIVSADVKPALIPEA